MQFTARNPKKVLVIIGFVVYIILSLVLVLKTSARAQSESLQNTRITGAPRDKEIEESRHLVEVVLNGATRYEITELFNKILNETPGVVQAKRYRFSLDPENPQRCRIDWQVEIKDSDPFQLESDLHRLILAAADAPGKASTLSGQFSEEIRASLRRIKPLEATSRRLQFFLLHADISGVKKTVKKNHWPDMGFD